MEELKLPRFKEFDLVSSDPPAKRALCLDDPFNPLISTTLQASGILVLSHFFHLILKPLGQPGPVGQILAGVVLGPSVLSRFESVNEYLIQASSADYYDVFSSIFCVLFMFMFGLETDISFMKRNLRKATIIAYGGLIVCSMFGLAASFLVIRMLRLGHPYALGNLIMIILSNAASPVVIRLAAELKFSTSDTGRLAISAALINEMSCVFWFSVFVAFMSWDMFGWSILFLSLTVILIVVNKYLAAWCDQRNRNQKYVSNTEMYFILSLVIAVSFIIEENGFNSAISSYIIGLMFPREGKTARTLGIKLAYACNNFILPIYFGYIGFQFNVIYLNSYRNLIAVSLLIILSMGGKIIGTLVACHYLNVPAVDGIMLSFLLNLKGHAELLVVGVLSKSIMRLYWDKSVHNLVVIVVVVNTVISGPVIAYILRRHEKYFGQRHTSLEFRQPETELRMLTCLYGSRHITAKIGLIFGLSGSLVTPTTAYLMHLVELPTKHRKKTLMYHELQDGDQFSDEEDYGGNEVVEINEAVDALTLENKLLIHQSKVVSSFAGMYEDVCNVIEDLRVSIVLLVFHKHQRLDGKLESGKEGIRLTNQKVLRHAPCSVGIFIDRGQTGFQLPTHESVQNVAVLFFGGPDDREALACSKRIAVYPHINFTLVRFLPPSSVENNNGFIDKTSRSNSEVLMEMSNHDMEAETDKAFVEDFCNRYVAPGQAKYEEKYVENQRQTMEALIGFGQRFSLVIVGKGRTKQSPIITGLSDWEECPELGTVGDLLASSDFNINASVLVIQQHSSKTTLSGDD
ncbi:cation/H(+) antiporter 2-like isoform X2 [Mercurialis annua]|uniref:cation/H(+) antiporter 2-like isoform X2 n=1 Tax=Mercurialis annua TaxID=3986 RepID=UPI002160CDF9|nr:cation/H(+) antiporter 2-like isoform X2 [Mercurialis annua]XP_050232073.1 cation/H(+) antiporter 2-like isoform X2 [Mercurialis annua]